jgi:tetratricopeptide (TPR) repeat protein
MILLLDILAFLLRSVAGLCLLLLALTLVKRPRKRFPILRAVGARRWGLILAACLAWALAHGAVGWRGILYERSWLALSQGPQGELVQKATQAALDEELKGAPAETGSQARAYFSAGERDLAGRRYGDAAASYERSVRAVPTASGYLNLAISLLYLEEFQSAEDAFRSGIQIAQRRGNDRMEGAYLDGLGRAALGLGQVESALGCHRAALEIHTQVGNPLGRANAHANIGDAYMAQARLEEALVAHREAFALYTRLGNLLGRANTLNRIGHVYSRLGRQDEAMRAFQEALSLDTRIANALGRARDLDGIASAYLAQGREREALEALRESRAISREIAGAAGDARATDRAIEHPKASGVGAR